jgi:hypothetical protein
MKTLFRKLLARKSSPKRRPPSRRILPQLEALEERQLLSVTPPIAPGATLGSLLQNVEAMPIFYGSGWHANAQTGADAAYMTAFLQDVVNSPYMDMLGNAGYQVGRGSVDPETFASDGQSEPDTLNASQTLTDASIQTTLQWWISNDAKFANLQPDGNRLYVIFVEPNVEVSNQFGTQTWTSGNEPGINHFFAYHSSFAGQDSSGNNVNIRYAVMPYLDGAINGRYSWLSTRDQMTDAASHELAEAVTDPDGSGYQDYSLSPSQEIGDLVANEVVYQDGFAVQREADPNDLPMTPSDAMPQRQVSFVLEASTRSMVTGNYFTGFHVTSVTTNELFERTPNGALSPVIFGGAPATGIKSISDQGIDNHGQAMIDVVFNSGIAEEYHDDGSWTYLGSSVTDARAGQGVSYVLFNGGTLKEWKDGSPNTGTADNAGMYPVATSVVAIDAGMDSLGVNMVVATVRLSYALTNTYEISDSTGWHYIASHVAQASAGRNGTVDFLDGSGNVYWWNETSGPAAQIASGATKVTTGYNIDGTDIIDILYSNGTVGDWRNGVWSQLTSNVSNLTKARAGVVDTIKNDGSAWEFPLLGGGYYEIFAALGSWVSGSNTRATAVA